jgi:hypothetical protein
MKKEPIRHHYIPRFILRKFCDENGELSYYDVNTKTVSLKRPEDVFVTRNLYRDTINHPDEPTQIEKDLAKFENESSRIIEKFLKDDDVILTIEEDEKLRLFFAIMGFRSERVQKQFGINADQVYKDFYGFYQADGNLTDFWKRNLGELVNCRSIKEVLDNPKIDDPIKAFMVRDTYGVTGMYFMRFEKRCKEDFVVSDAYPGVMEGLLDNGIGLPLYYLYPISKQIMILLIANGAELSRQAISGFDKKMFKKPKLSVNGKHLHIKTQRVYEQDVKKLNQILIDNATEGIVGNIHE